MAQIIYEHDSMNSLSGPTPHSHDTKERGPLFICTHNAIRSPMAANIYTHYTNGRPVASAGVYTKYIHPLVFTALRESGMTIYLEEGEPLDGLDLSAYSILVALSQTAHSVLQKRNAQHVFWQLDDIDPLPTGEGNHEAAMVPFRRLRSDLITRIQSQFLEHNSIEG